MVVPPEMKRSERAKRARLERYRSITHESFAEEDIGWYITLQGEEGTLSEYVPFPGEPDA